MRHHTALGGRVGTGRFGVLTHPTRAKEGPGGRHGSLWGQTNENRAFYQRSQILLSYTLVGHWAIVDLGRFLTFFCWFAPFQQKNGDFLAAQPPNRPFDRPARWRLMYLRARYAQTPRHC